jgi:hypothetical protein
MWSEVPNDCVNFGNDRQLPYFFIFWRSACYEGRADPSVSPSRKVKQNRRGMVDRGAPPWLGPAQRHGHGDCGWRCGRLKKLRDFASGLEFVLWTGFFPQKPFHNKNCIGSGSENYEEGGHSG